MRAFELVVDEGVLDAVAVPFADVIGQEDLVEAALFVAVAVGLLRAVTGEVEDHEIARFAVSASWSSAPRIAALVPGRRRRDAFGKVLRRRPRAR